MFGVNATYVLRLFRAHNANAAAYGVRYVVSAAQRRHIPFYRQRLKMEAVTEPMPVPGLTSLSLVTSPP